MAADNNYAPYTAVTMASILKNTDRFIDFYILSDNISAKNKVKIANEKKFFKNFSLQFVELDGNKLQQIKKNTVKNHHVTRAAYARIFIPELDVAKNISKGIYLDTDVIYLNDIGELYNQDLDGKIVGTVSDCYKMNDKEISNASLCVNKSSKNLQKKFNTPEKHIYFNSGMLLIDFDKWRKHRITEKTFKLLQDIYQRKDITYFLHDQDGLNIVLAKNNKNLNISYNMTIHNLKEMNYEYIYDVIKKAHLIHYTCHPKPWFDKKTSYKTIWWDYVKYTDFEEEIENAYKEYKLIFKIDSINKNIEKVITIAHVLICLLLACILLFLAIGFFIKKK